MSLLAEARVRWLLVAALLLRLLTVSAVLLIDPERALTADAGGYLRPADALRVDLRFDTAPGSGVPEFLRTPGLPLLLAVIRALAGTSIAPILVVNALMTTATVLAVVHLARRTGSASTGLVAGILVALEPLQIIYSAFVLTEPLFSLLLVLTVTALVTTVQAAPVRVRPALVTGTLLALATMVRPITYYLPVVLAIVVGLQVRRSGARVALLVIAALLLPSVLIVGGWQVRNSVQVGSSRLSGIEALNLYTYRAAAVVALRQDRPFDDLLLEFRGNLPQADDEPDGAYYDRMRSAGLDILVADPVAVMRTTMTGLARTVFSPPVGAGQFGTSLPTPLALVVAAWWYALYLLATAGLLAGLREREHRAAHIAMLTVVVYLLVLSAGPEGYSRFRTPVMPIVAVWAALGVAWMRAQRVTSSAPPG